MKKLLSVLLVLMIIAGSFIGCSKSSKESSNEESNAFTNNSQEDTAKNSSHTDSGSSYAPTIPAGDDALPEGTQQITAAPGTIEWNDSEGGPLDKTSAGGISDQVTAGSLSEQDASAVIPSENSMAAPKDTQDMAGYRYWNYYFQGYNTEEYTPITEIGFKDTISSPLSTFSIDVDTASYTNLRKNLNDGMIPAADAIRIEEMLNYFDYEYNEPTGNVPFTINTEIAECPWNEENYLLMVGIQGKNVDKESLPKSNMVFLLDVSGSMDEPDKLPLLKSAFSKLTDELGEDDRISIVVYADNSGVVLDSVRGSDKERIQEAIDGLSAGGSTGGAEGIDVAYRMAEKNFIEGGNNRIILATDGDFNVGPSSVEELESIIEEKRQSGIFLSVMGFGSGNLKDNRLETLADKGNGNYSYIDSVKEAKRVLVNEMAGTLLTIAKDVKIQLEFNPYRVAGYRLIGYENRALADEDFENDTVDAGELGAGHTVTALYEVIPAGSQSVPEKDLKYQTGETGNNQEFKNEISEIRLRYKKPEGEESREIRQVVSLQNTPVNREPSEDFYFAAAVAEFGMIIRGSQYQGNATLDSALKLAEKGLGEDESGYRLEFMELIDLYEELLTYHW